MLAVTLLSWSRGPDDVWRPLDWCPYSARAGSAGIEALPVDAGRRASSLAAADHIVAKLR